MSAGSYFPKPVKSVAIPKKDRGKRTLGILTISERIAQMVVKQELEPALEQIFHEDSFGYRPKQSALDAVILCKNRCWKFRWVVDIDIKGFFDNIYHDLVVKAVKFHTDNPWLIIQN
ncbi:MAG: reverse transcriptase domain-containing protein [Bacteriovoracaceae bacterium]|nr:reverse transcriptase domain-containing protein [Bacteriovoracaceae bacterium]